MKPIQSLSTIFPLFSIVLLYVSIPPVFGKAPDTAKKRTIYIANRDGTGLQQIVDEAGAQARDPIWSPRGDALIYTQAIDDHLQLFKIDLGSRTPIQLTHVVGLARFQANSLADWFDPVVALPVSPQPVLLTTTWGEVKIGN